MTKADHNPLRAALERFGRERRGQPQQEPAHSHRWEWSYADAQYECPCGETQTLFAFVAAEQQVFEERQAGGHVHTRRLSGNRVYGHCVARVDDGSFCAFEASEQWWLGWEARGVADAAAQAKER